ncbi:imm11 family protein [Heyndrickxia sporothermodurans]
MSLQFKSLLESMDGMSVQFLPIKVINSKDGSTLIDYYVTNVLNVIDVLDLESSDYSVIELDDEKVFNIKKYAINAESAKGHNIFKMKGYEIPLFISELTMNEIISKKITGCDFLENKVIS